MIKPASKEAPANKNPQIPARFDTVPVPKPGLSSKPKPAHLPNLAASTQEEIQRQNCYEISLSTTQYRRNAIDECTDTPKDRQKSSRAKRHAQRRYEHGGTYGGSKGGTPLFRGARFATISGVGLPQDGHITILPKEPVAPEMPASVGSNSIGVWHC